MQVDDETSVLKYTRFNLKCVKFIGLLSTDKPLFQTKFYWIYAIIVNVFLMGLFNVLQVIYALRILPDVEMFARSGYVAFTCFVATLKGTAFLRNRQLIQKLMTTLRDETFQPRNERQARQFEREMRPYKVIFYSYIVMGSLTVLGWIATPILTSAPMDLTFPSWYPFDVQRPVVYQLTYLHQSISISFVAATNVNMDSLTGAFFSYVSAECVLLADTIKNLYGFTKDRLGTQRRLSTGMSEEETHRLVVQEMNTTLLDCVEHYKKIIGFAIDVQECYNSIAFAQFATSITSFCLTLYLLALVSLNSSETFTVISYQVCLSMALFLYCWFGNNVIFKSAEIYKALYECPWMDCSETFKKNILFFTMRSQRVIQMYAIDFFLINLPTFISIGRAAWSVFLLLRNLKID